MTPKKTPEIQAAPPASGLHFRTHEFQAAPTGWHAHYFTNKPGETITHPLAGWLTMILIDHDHHGVPNMPLHQDHYPRRIVRAAITNPRTGHVVDIQHPTFYRVTGPGYELDETDTIHAWHTWKNQQEDDHVETQ